MPLPNPLPLLPLPPPLADPLLPRLLLRLFPPLLLFPPFLEGADVAARFLADGTFFRLDDGECEELLLLVSSGFFRFFEALALDDFFDEVLLPLLLLLLLGVATPVASDECVPKLSILESFCFSASSSSRIFCCRTALASFLAMASGFPRGWMGWNGDVAPFDGLEEDGFGLIGRCCCCCCCESSPSSLGVGGASGEGERDEADLSSVAASSCVLEDSSFFTAFDCFAAFVFGFAFPFAFLAASDDFFFPPDLPLLSLEGADLEDFEVVRLFLLVCFVDGFGDCVVGAGSSNSEATADATAWTAALLPFDADEDVEAAISLLVRRWSSC